jgi:hypothetical protein
MNAEAVKKEVIKSRVVANIKYYAAGNLYYTVKLESGLHQFPISTIEKEEDLIKLASDLGTTPFEAEMKGSYLNRWIERAIKNDEFIRIGN